jgi:predicted HAD superfamily Cof-like phosphohydrolase
MSLKTKSFLSTQAQEFRDAYKVANSKSRTSRNTQKTLIVEEFKEFLEAEDALFRDHVSFRADALKELADLVYVCYQYAANIGWDLDEALNRVHRSNMSKLDDNGQPIYRADGKVLKGPSYQPPNLNDLV